jgi:dihydroneopterin aldolase
VAASESITLRGMRFHVLVGVLPHEQEYAQPVEVDVTVWRAAPVAAARESAEQPVIDYRDIYDAVSTRMSAGPLRLLEDVARTLVGDLLTRPSVGRARVAVRKPHVPLGGPLAHAEVVVDSGRPPADA